MYRNTHFLKANICKCICEHIFSRKHSTLKKYICIFKSLQYFIHPCGCIRRLCYQQKKYHKKVRFNLNYNFFPHSFVCILKYYYFISQAKRVNKLKLKYMEKGLRGKWKERKEMKWDTFCTMAITRVCVCILSFMKLYTFSSNLETERLW